jgi:ligand-binding sensor domain-containing protein
MKKPNRRTRSLQQYVWVFLILACLTACKKTMYELADPATAGVWTLMNTGSGLPANQIRDIKRDTQNNLWVAFSGSGVGMYRDGVWTYYNTSNSSILSNSVTSLGPTLDGGMIVGTLNGIAIRSSSGVWSSYKDPNVTTMVINTIKVASDGSRWLGTEGEGFYVDFGSGYSQIYASTFANVHAIEEDNLGDIFLGTDNGLLEWNGSKFTLYTTANGLPDNYTQSLYLDSKKRLWIGTSGGPTVCWMNSSSGNFTQLSLLNSDAGSFVRSIYEDKRGHIWFATWFDGLVEYDNVVPFTYKVYNGFYENDVNCIGDDENGNLWIGLYSKGLIKYTLPLDNTSGK